MRAVLLTLACLVAQTKLSYVSLAVQKYATIWGDIHLANCSLIPGGVIE